MNNQTNDLTITKISKVLDIFKNSEAHIRPHFILTGPSGSGKSYTVKNLVEQKELAFIEINAAQLTKEGTSGNSLSKALTPLLQYGDSNVVCFVDEFDKLFISGNSNSEVAHETTNGVQNEFLTSLEADTTSVFHDYGKYVQASVKNVLFIFAGAFNGQTDISLDSLRTFGIKTEFLGRVGLVFNMDKYSITDLTDMLTINANLDNYLKLFPEKNKDSVVSEISKEIEVNYEKNTLGARIIDTFVHQYFINGKIVKKENKKSSFQKVMKF